MSEPVEPVRVAHRRITRDRICEAARELFFRQGFHGARLEDIAQAAGVSRSTLYLHFSDRDAILAAIARQYALGLTQLVELLPAPRPSRVDVRAWAARLADFVERERIPTVLIVELSDGGSVPVPIRRIGDELMAALAIRFPAFARAKADGQKPSLARAWSDTVFRELGWACLRHARYGRAMSSAALEVAARLLHAFIHDCAFEDDHDGD